MAHQPRIDLSKLPRKTPWAWSVATFFGVGLLRPGPGTYGSIAAVLLWYGAIHATHPGPLIQNLGTVAAALGATLVGIPAATIVARESLREDPGHVVIDEVAGQWIALIAIPADWRHAVLALVLFRLFDILKPPPIPTIERFPGGVGIVFDDVMAGLFALVFGLLARHFF